MAEPSLWLNLAWQSGWMLLVLFRSGCNWFPAANLSPLIEPPEYVVPASWHRSSIFVETMPSDVELLPDWWTLYGDPVLDERVEQAIRSQSGSSGHSRAVRSAGNMMMNALAQYLPQVDFAPGVYAIIYDYNRCMARSKEDAHEDDIH